MIRYITKHMRANILQVLLLCLVLMASVGVIVFASTFYFALSEHTVAGSVESQLEEFIMFISFAFAAFSFWVLYAITSITIGHREPEILVLHNTNTPDKRIIQFLFFELCITALIALIPGILLGQGVAYMVLTHANVPITEYGRSLVYLLLGSFIIALFLMSYIICNRAVVVKKKTSEKANKAQRSDINWVWLVLGLVELAIGAYMDNVLFVVGIVSIMFALQFVAVRLLRTYARKVKSVSLLVSSSYILHNKKVYSSIIMNILIASMLFLGLFLMFDNMRYAVTQFVIDDYQFDYVVATDGSAESESLLADISTDYTTFYLSEYRNNGELIMVYGIDEDYTNFTTFPKALMPTIQQDNSIVSSSSFSSSETEVVWVFGENTVIDNSFESLYPYNMYESKEDFLNNDKLSEYTTMAYVRTAEPDFQEKYDNYFYEIVSTEEIKKEAVADVIKGTEIIEVILYLYLAYAMFSCLNIFLLFYKQREQNYRVFDRINISEKTLVRMSIVEVLIILLYAIVLSIPVSMMFYEGGMAMVATQYLIRVKSFYIDYGRFLTTYGLLTCGSLLGVYCITKNMLKRVLQGHNSIRREL